MKGKTKKILIITFTFLILCFNNIFATNSNIEAEKKIKFNVDAMLDNEKEETDEINKKIETNESEDIETESTKKIKANKETNEIEEKDNENVETDTEDNVEETDIEENETNETENINNSSINENKDYIEQVFKNDEDIYKIQSLLKDFNKRDFDKVFKDFSKGNYEDIITKFINNYSEIFSEFKIEFSKEKYLIFYSDIIDKWENDEKYKNLKEDIESVMSNYEEESAEIIKLFSRYQFKTLFSNLNEGKYKNYLNDIWKVFTNSKYKTLIDEINEEFTEGEYADIFYDFIYYLLDTTYKYNLDFLIDIEETETETTTEVIEETTNSQLIPIPLLLGGLGALLLIILILVLIFRKKKQE